LRPLDGRSVTVAPTVADEGDVAPPAQRVSAAGRTLGDARRLRALESTGLLDTPSEACFDRWTRMAARLTGAEAAILTLVTDDRVFVKSYQRADGRDDGLPGSSASLEVSLCHLAVSTGVAMVQEDGTSLPHVGAIVSLPVRSGDGDVLGAFCTFSSKPRAWSEDDLETLRGLAAATESELRRRIARGATQRLRALLDTHDDAHRLMTEGASLDTVLDQIVRGVQAQSVGMVGSILLLDDERRRFVHAAAPDLPTAWTDAIDGVEIGPRVGSCGTAAFTGRDQLVADVREDARWTDFQELAVSHGLISCWSVPMRDGHGVIIGTFALYSPGPRMASGAEVDLLHQAGRLAAIAVDRDRGLGTLRTLAERDSLTGLPNREHLTAELQRRLDVCDAPVAVLFCDLDRFKLINDSLGHAAGDAVLRGVAARLTATARTGDVVGRLGGDEFVIVLAGEQDAAGARQAAERLLDGLDAPLPDDHGRPHSVTASVGVALVGGRGMNRAALGGGIGRTDRVDASEAIRRADSAMYAAKRARRPIGVYDSHEDRQRAERLVIVDALAQAVRNDELQVVYQPIVALDDARTIAVEALARWHHPHLGDVPPDRFIPIAEEHGLIGSIGGWILERAIRDTVASDDPGLCLSVNVSTIELTDERLPGRVLAMLDEVGLDPQRLQIEITETALLEHSAVTLGVLDGLRAAGIGVVLDDFGTGCSSLTHLHALPIDGFKIDRSFISAATSPRSRALAEGLIALGTGLGLTVTAEGIETAEQARWLARRGCALGQGYRFGRPVPSDASPIVKR
jgi:diguanylate cyclase (GGDEF)-like protein